MKYAILLLIFIGALGFHKKVDPAPKSGAELLAKSIAYHDPQGLLQSERVVLKLNEPRPGGKARITTLTFDTPKEYFSVNRNTGEHMIFMESKTGAFSYTLDGSVDATYEQIDKFKLTEERLKLLYNYYHYLWFLPGKLNDPGTIIHDEIPVKEFFGKKGYQLKVTYDPAVGKDIWYFYFDQKTYELIGYRFYHDESKNDGEYILIDGAIENQGVTIPAQRKWYKHQKDEYLGEDILVGLELKKAH